MEIIIGKKYKYPLLNKYVKIEGFDGEDWVGIGFRIGNSFYEKIGTMIISEDETTKWENCSDEEFFEKLDRLEESFSERFYGTLQHLLQRKSICEERGISEKLKFKQDFLVDRKTKPQLTLSATFFANTVLSVVDSVGK